MTFCQLVLLVAGVVTVGVATAVLLVARYLRELDRAFEASWDADREM